MADIIADLVRIRKLKELSQSEVAKKLHIAQSYLARLEAHRLDPGLSRVEEIARFYGHTLMLVPNEKIPAVNMEITEQRQEKAEDVPLYSTLRNNEDEAVETFLQDLK